jgi:hypothetical protein
VGEHGRQGACEKCFQDLWRPDGEIVVRAGSAKPAQTWHAPRLRFG